MYYLGEPDSQGIVHLRFDGLRLRTKLLQKLHLVHRRACLLQSLGRGGREMFRQGADQVIDVLFDARHQVVQGGHGISMPWYLSQFFPQRHLLHQELGIRSHSPALGLQVHILQCDEEHMTRQ